MSFFFDYNLPKNVDGRGIGSVAGSATAEIASPTVHTSSSLLSPVQRVPAGRFGLAHLPLSVFSDKFGDYDKAVFLNQYRESGTAPFAEFLGIKKVYYCMDTIFLTASRPILFESTTYVNTTSADTSIPVGGTKLLRLQFSTQGAVKLPIADFEIRILSVDANETRVASLGFKAGITFHEQEEVTLV